MIRRALVALALFPLAVRAVGAHDFWIEPSSFRPEAGERVAFRLLVGDGFPGEGYARNPRHLLRFERIGKEGPRAISGMPGQDPAGSALAEGTGREVAIYESVATRVELEAGKFERYLEEVGLERVLALRAERGMSAEAGRELFSRSAKTVVGVTAEDSSGFDRLTGLPLELVPEVDPLALLPGDLLPVRVLFAGRPLAGALLRTFHRERSGAQVRVRTDKEGRAQIALDDYGVWMISTVYMVEADEGAGADWRSFWASLTLSIDP